MRALRSQTPTVPVLGRLSPQQLRLLHQLGRLADERGIALYLVGGVVRDLLLNRETWDLDFTVEGDGIAFARVVADRYRAGLAVFERFGTARMVLRDGRKVDIASARRESYEQPAALPEVTGSCLEDDLYRRDFTINAMAIQLSAGRFGSLHDPYGGRRDLQQRTLRVLHERSFCDDPTRMFRAVRFMQRFGFRMEARTRVLLRQAARQNVVSRLSGPRLCNEIMLLLNERKPERAIDLLLSLNLLRFVHPRLRYDQPTRRLVTVLGPTLLWWAHRKAPAEIDRSLCYLMALLSHSSPAVSRALSIRLQLSSAQALAVAQAGRPTDRLAHRLGRPEPLSASGVYRLLTGLPTEALVLIAAKSLVRQGAEASSRCRRRLARFLDHDRFVSLVLTGRDLAALGLSPGPAYGRILKRLLDAKLDGELPTGKAERQMAVRLVCGAVNKR